MCRLYKTGNLFYVYVMQDRDQVFHMCAMLLLQGKVQKSQEAPAIEVKAGIFLEKVRGFAIVCYESSSVCHCCTSYNTPDFFYFYLILGKPNY